MVNSLKALAYSFMCEGWHSTECLEEAQQDYSAYGQLSSTHSTGVSHRQQAAARQSVSVSDCCRVQECGNEVCLCVCM